MANLLVTGGAGFIGGNFLHFWASSHPDDTITVVDSLTYAGNRATVAALSQVDLIEGDIRDTALVERLLDERRIDTVVHFAAESHVDRSIDSPDAFIDTNINGTYSLLKAARAVWLEKGTGHPHRFHHVSTDEVYGSLGADEPPVCETRPYAPNSPYSASKAASDHLVRAYHQTYGLEVTTTYCSNNYGPFQHPEKLIPKILLHALFGYAMPIYGDGRNIRDWLHVEDHCRGIAACLAKGEPGQSYNLGGGTELTNLDVIERLCVEIDHAFDKGPGLSERFASAPAAQGLPTSSLKSFVEDRAGHDRRYAISSAKANEHLGYAPTHNFKDGLSATVTWYLENEDWWRNLVSFGRT